MPRTGDRARLHRGARPRARRDRRVPARAGRRCRSTEVATATGLARPTARRILLTLEELGYVRAGDAGFALTPRVLELGVAYVRSTGPVGRRPPAHGAAGRRARRVVLDRPARRLGHRLRRPGGRAEDRRRCRCRSARGSRRCRRRSGKVLLAALPADELDRVLAEPTRSGLRAALAARPGRARRGAARGAGARMGAHRRAARARASGRLPRRCATASGRVVASVNVNAHAAETPVDAAARGAPAAAAAGRRGHQRRLRPAATTVPHVTVRRRPDAAPPAVRQASAATTDGQLSVGGRRAVTGRRSAAPRPAGRCRACSSPTSPGCWPARTPRCCWPTWAPRSSRSRAPTATRPARWTPPVPRRASRPTTWASTAASARSRSTCATPPTLELARELARRADVLIENFKPGGLAQVRPGLRHGERAPTRGSSTPRSAGSAPGRARRCPATTSWCRRSPG